MSKNKLIFNQEIKKKAILYDIVLPKESKILAKKRLEETSNLLDTFGGVTLTHIIQKRDHGGSTSFIGREKLIEVLNMMVEMNSNLLILNTSLKASQLYKIEEIMENKNMKNVEVWDRVELILRIFSQHAHTKLSKLQLELAKIEHMGPRIYKMGLEMSQQGAGIGTRGIGESNTEIMRRHLFQYKNNVMKQIDKLKKSRELNKKRRKDKGFKNVSIVGYTNAGKSLLFQNLSKKKTYVKDELFATLDTKVAKLYVGEDINITLTDTIGFIQYLPVELISAFKSTLEETMDADMLLHVIDISDENKREKIRTVEDIIDSITIGEIPTLYVFNKVDKINDLSDIPKIGDINPILVSAKLKEGFFSLKKEIVNFFQD